MEPLADTSIQRVMQPTFDSQHGGKKDYEQDQHSNRSKRKALENMKKRIGREGANSRMHFDRDPAHRPTQKERKELRPFGDRDGQDNGQGGRMYDPNGVTMRNKRTVWEIATQAYKEPHFATFPEKLVEPCILAGSRPGDTVLDPFAGSGTAGKVAMALGRMFVGIELNQKYAEMAERRMSGIQVPLQGVER